MTIKSISAVYFSPCGNVKKAVTAMAGAAAGALGVSAQEVDITLPAAREQAPRFGAGELVFVGFPVYAGRIPNKLAPFAGQIAGNGALAVPVVCYGNRSFDDALSELYHLLLDNGFAVPAAAALVTEHSFTPLLAPGRPDEADMARIRAFGRQAAEKAALAPDGAFPPLPVPGLAHPTAYYTPLGTDGAPARFLKAVPAVDETLCDRCGVCARVCPMGSIDAASPGQTRGICIKCHACVRACPQDARRFTDPAFLSHRAMLVQNYRRPLEDLFLL